MSQPVIVWDEMGSVRTLLNSYRLQSLAAALLLKSNDTGMHVHMKMFARLRLR